MTEDSDDRGFRFERRGRLPATWGRSSAEAVARPRRSAPWSAPPRRVRMPEPSSTSSTDVDEPTVVVGVVTKVHGLRGEVAVEVRSDNPDRFARRRAAVHRATAASSRSSGRTVTAPVCSVHSPGWRTARPPRRCGARRWSSRSPGSPSCPTGEYWPFQLEGCAVLTESGRALGTLAEVIPNPANDLWVARDDAGNGDTGSRASAT